MPLVRIDIPSGWPDSHGAAIGGVVHEAMVEHLGVPSDDRFQIIASHEPGTLVVDPHYLGIARSDAAIIVQVTLNSGRSTDMKRAFYRAVADGLHDRVGLRRGDVIISLVEVDKENWSFGDGEAQYA